MRQVMYAESKNNFRFGEILREYNSGCGWVYPREWNAAFGCTGQREV